MRGLFATVEGIDGSGKTTVAARVADALGASGIPVEHTREPTRTWRGDAVRWAIEGEVDPTTEFFLFLADRHEHTARIRESVAAGNLVLSDRYADSTYAYQGARLAGTMPDPVAWLERMSKPFVTTPDVSYFLAVPPDVALTRIAGRAKKVRFEHLSFLAAVDANYRELAKDRRFVTIDAQRPAEAVAADMADDLRQRWTKRPTV